MSTLRRYFVFCIFAFAVAIFLGCSDSESPVSEQLNNETFDAYANMFSEDFNFLEANGIGVDSSNGVFSIGWNEFFDPMNNDTVTQGHALVAVFTDINSPTPRPMKNGIDIGSVFISYQNNHIELQKIVNPRGGVLYSLFPRFNTGDELDFIPNAVYEFEVTGSSNFGPLNIPLTAPPALMDFTSHANGDMIDPNSDLTLTWSGGSANDPVAIHILPEMVFQPVFTGGGTGLPPIGDFGNGGHGPHDGSPGHRPHPMPQPLPIHLGIFELLPNNPGQYTVAAADLQNLLNNTNATRIICHVSQMNGSEVDHEGKILRTVMRNGDQLMLGVL